MPTRRNMLRALTGGAVATAIGMPTLRRPTNRVTMVEAAPAAVPATVGTVQVADPFRILDTRIGLGYSFPKPQPTQRFTVLSGINGASGLYMNLTVTETEGPGFVTLWSGIGEPPNASSINWDRAGQILSNMVLCPVGQGGGFGVAVSAQSACHIVIDVMGSIART